MLFMVIEKFRDQNALAVYRQFRAKGRQMPDGLTFVGSWVTADVARCFQLMATEDPSLFSVWIDRWKDLADFEVVEIGETPRGQLTNIAGEELKHET